MFSTRSGCSASALAFIWPLFSTRSGCSASALARLLAGRQLPPCSGTRFSSSPTSEQRLVADPTASCLALILLTWTIWRAPTNASKWRMGFNSAFKGLMDTEIISPAVKRPECRAKQSHEVPSLRMDGATAPYIYVWSYFNNLYLCLILLILSVHKIEDLLFITTSYDTTKLRKNFYIVLHNTH